MGLLTPPARCSTEREIAGQVGLENALHQIHLLTLIFTRHICILKALRDPAVKKPVYHCLLFLMQLDYGILLKNFIIIFT